MLRKYFVLAAIELMRVKVSFRALLQEYRMQDIRPNQKGTLERSVIKPYACFFMLIRRMKSDIRRRAMSAIIVNNCKVGWGNACFIFPEVTVLDVFRVFFRVFLLPFRIVIVFPLRAAFYIFDKLLRVSKNSDLYYSLVQDHVLSRAVSLDVLGERPLVGLSVNTLKHVPKSKVTRDYKPFKVHGSGAVLRLRGGEAFSTCGWSCVLIKGATVFGRLNGVAHRGKVITPFVDGYHDDYSIDGFPNLSVLKLLNLFRRGYDKNYPRDLRKCIYIDCCASTSQNYFHFIIDTLPALLMSILSIRKRREDWNSFKVLIPVDVHPNINKILLDVLGFYGLGHQHVRPTSIFECDEIVVSNFPSFLRASFPRNTNFSVNALAIRYTRMVLRRVYKNVPALGQSKLYISRGKSVGGNSRHVKNYHEISEKLRSNGYRTVDFAGMSLEEQVSLMISVQRIVIDGGAALANLVFAKDCRKLVLLAMDKGTDSSLFVSFCQVLGVEISYACGPVVPGQVNISSWQRSYTVSVETVIKAIGEE